MHVLRGFVDLASLKARIANAVQCQRVLRLFGELTAFCCTFASRGERACITWFCGLSLFRSTFAHAVLAPTCVTLGCVY